MSDPVEEARPLTEAGGSPSPQRPRAGVAGDESGMRAESTHTQVRAGKSLSRLALECHLDPNDLVKRVRESSVSFGRGTASTHSGSIPPLRRSAGYNSLGSRRETAPVSDDDPAVSSNELKDVDFLHHLHSTTRGSSSQRLLSNPRGSINSRPTSASFSAPAPSPTANSTPVIAAPILQNLAATQKKVQFANQIENVVLYKVDDSLWVDVKYKRNKIGWVLAVFMILVYIGYDFYLERIPRKKDGNDKFNFDLLFFWTRVWAAILYIVMLGCAHFSGVGGFNRSEFRVLGKCSVFLPFLGQGIAQGMRQFLRSAATLFAVEFAPLFGPALTMSLVFLLFIRFLRGVPTFRVEWIPSIVAVGCAFIAAAPMFQVRNNFSGIWVANVLQLLSSVMWVIEFLFLEYTKNLSESILVRLWPLVLTSLFWNTLSCVGRGVFAQYGAMDHFTEWYFLPSFLTATISLVLDSCLLGLVRYVDVQSIGAIYAAKAIVDPYMSLIMTPLSGKSAFFGAGLYVATGPMLVACFTIIVFASEKRRWVAHFITGGTTAEEEDYDDDDDDMIA